MTFASSHPALARALVARDYTVPTAVQLAVLEADAALRDLLVSAQTGSGKTVAFGLAMAPTLLGEAERLERAGAPLALIIAPTRELALQVQRELDWLYEPAGARVVTCVGGMDGRAEARQLGFGAHIVVGTPGRLRDHLERQRLDLSQLKTIVLDEADEMLDLGFREDLEFILDATPAERQTLLFSATMPREIERLAKHYQRDAIRIETIGRNEQHSDIDYQAMRVAPGDVENAVVNVLRLHEARATLVFCATREAVKRTHARLLERGFSAVALSGELTQNERTQALLALRDGRARVLVATDVAARGLDLPDLALVIHADLPNDGETLLHRSGRTGRAGRKGLCTLIVPFNRRRKADALLAAAKIAVTWRAAPTPDEIRARDQERFQADGVFADQASDEELVEARNLQAARSADEIAVALLRMHRARLPAPEEMAIDAGPPRRREYDGPGREAFVSSNRREAAGSSNRHDDSAARTPRAPRPPREDARDMVWFRLNIGRERNADPRWLLPLICKAGGISKSEIGSIKIFDRDTRFQVLAEIADRFADAVRTSKHKEGHISRVGAHTPAEDAAVNQAIQSLTSAAPRRSKWVPSLGPRDGAAADEQNIDAETRHSSERRAAPIAEGAPQQRAEASRRDFDKPRKERAPEKEKWSPKPRRDEAATGQFATAADEPARERPAKVWSDRPKSGAGKSGAGKSGAGKSGAGKSGVGKPAFGKSEFGKSGRPGKPGKPGKSVKPGKPAARKNTIAADQPMRRKLRANATAKAAIAGSGAKTFQSKKQS